MNILDKINNLENCINIELEDYKRNEEQNITLLIKDINENIEYCIKQYVDMRKPFDIDYIKEAIQEIKKEMVKLEEDLKIKENKSFFTKLKNLFKKQ